MTSTSIFLILLDNECSMLEEFTIAMFFVGKHLRMIISDLSSIIHELDNN